jgi:homogentisate 1,2-dioxygenase
VKETKAKGRGKSKASAGAGASSGMNGKEEKKADTSDFKYLSGFGAEHSSEALDGALPKGQFMPQK